MKTLFLGSALLLLSSHFLRAQSTEYFGARAAGIGHTAITVSDEWSSYYNSAGLSTQKRMAVGLGYRNEYALASLKNVALVVAGPLFKGGAALSFYKSGTEVYNINRVSLAYAHKISLVSLGGQVHYVQMAIEGLSTRSNCVLEFGGIAELVPSRLFFGASIANLNQAKLAGELLPVMMKAGLSYRPIRVLMLNAEVEKDLLYHSTMKAGLEYALIPQFFLRTGINTNPFVNFFGTGFQNNRLKLDYAVGIHNRLGYAHKMSLSLFLIKQK